MNAGRQGESPPTAARSDSGMTLPDGIEGKSAENRKKFLIGIEVSMPKPISEGRMINKSISNSEGFAALSPEAAVLFAMLIPWFSAHGKMNGGPGYIKDEVCPKVRYLTYQNIPALLDEISTHTNVKWFRVDGRCWLHSLHFLTEHQKLRNMGDDRLPSYTPEAAPPASEVLRKPPGSTSAPLIKVEVEEEGEAEGGAGGISIAGRDRCKDGKTAPAEGPKPAPAGKTAGHPRGTSEEEKKELRELVARVNEKHPKLKILVFLGNNIRAHPLAVRHVLRSLLKAENVDHPLSYLQKSLDVENAKYNARDSEAEAQERKKPVRGETENLGGILRRIAAGGRGP